MSNNKVKKTYIEFFIYLAALLILLITSININNFMAAKKILGINSSIRANKKDFWEDFLNKNPNYIPGLIETNQFKKVKEIDPNYVIP